ncbi:hypothetical protein MNEG_13410 [Monoraphidium neglectum]|uniref:Uncharacterized protein n=1 Tax=Monoraphidium neglectum TaxID=145388 RepID=A0A0D2KF94_9CHLO|nr:hypothetical protein MNEG_13410 [Monoraphidium neglectum]KIY94553.1 hypothetical protein MNEG_13410 [Monoraphidium neglectum]|eukprot:XP_013893573.1 hypothetical protein MNEG_13410 [Monoraphidium neglectum]
MPHTDRPYRPKAEALEKPLARIRASVAPPEKKQKRKKGQQGAPPEETQQQAERPAAEALVIELYEDAEGTRAIDPSTANADAWLAGSLLRVGPDLFEVCINPPTVETLTLQAFPLVGYPLLPAAQLAFADADACRWRWLRRRAGGGDWEPVGGVGGGGACYAPAEEDEGCMLRVECTPARDGGGGGGNGGGGAAALGEPVSADCGPVLFDYCPTPLLDNNYRRQLVLEEVVAYQVGGGGRQR